MTVTVDSSPTKEFFVEMLTRDIDLTDAILDLLDMLSRIEFIFFSTVFLEISLPISIIHPTI